MRADKKVSGFKGRLIQFCNFRIFDKEDVQGAKLTRTDAIVIALLVVAGCVGFVCAASIWGSEVMRLAVGGRWFQSDGWRVFDDMTNFAANHHRDAVHPLFSLVSIAATSLIKLLAPVSDARSIHIFNGIVFLVWISLVYSTMRLIGTRILDAVLLTALAATSAGSMFWFLAPETYLLGTLSIVLCLFVVALASRRDWPWVVAAAMSLSFTVTNWMAGLAALIVNRSLGRAAILAAASLVLVIAGWGVAKAVFPQPGSLFLLPNVVKGETVFVGHEDAGGIPEKLSGALVGPIVAPDLQRTSPQETGPLLSFQATAVTTWSSGNVLFLVAAALWMVVLAYCVARLIARPTRFNVSLGLTLLGQLVLHLIYGDETFLYALHFVPLLVLVVATALSTGKRRVLAPAVAILLAVVFANNVARLNEAANEPFSGVDERLERLSNSR